MKADRRIRSRKRNRRRNKGIGGLLCAVIVSAGLCLAAPPVTAAGAEAGPAEAQEETAGQQNGSGAGATATGTVILLGAGAYTAVRKQWNEKKNAKPKEYVYFENHTKNGTLRDEEKYIE